MDNEAEKSTQKLGREEGERHQWTQPVHPTTCRFLSSSFHPSPQMTMPPEAGAVPSKWTNKGECDHEKEQMRAEVAQGATGYTRNKSPGSVTDCGHRRCPRLRGPQLGPVIQRVDQLGCQLDVIAHYLLVLCDAIDVTNTSGQISVHTRTQFTLPEL